MTIVTNDGLLAVAERLGVQTLPQVLSVAPQQDSRDEWATAQQRAVTDLTGAGVIDSYGEVEPSLADALFTLAQPDRELVARVFTGGAPIRICLARRDEQHALAVRTGDDYDIGPVWSDGSGAALARPVLAVLGRCAAADVVDVSAPARELSERLESAQTSAEYADALYALGVADQDAPRYGLAFASCHAYAEIVAYAHIDGVTTRPPAAVAVYDTGHGRLVAAPGVAADQQVWSTVTPGTDHRIAQAISALVEALPGGRWLPQ
ncbi:ESX secretion-associated protein EspG [Nocardia cyriacigeorgica]|uniref:ESX secretion-associated protein EspG n=1 Tax=Nocardia cyriacigeorgica TaxID=135487 RepID=A0ABX0CLI5_9NOCA|nr:ESX secretion-associated protein EspG [Nocardia cyriacigeorgica]NEW39056.1 ESX secretion-associated protein EspG [Nocardia cyriacigeorgica]NEW57379.1 ESX secretion-associated protein EspG [Nocardia cyriacigeorgica]